MRDNHRMNALDGIRVLDLSRVLAGPWCTQTLGDLGADVIKIERPPSAQQPGGDDTRGWGPPFLQDAGADSRDSAYYLGCNRNKRSVLCDIASPEGQAMIRALVPHCHVLVENYKLGDMARYGLSFEALAAINPKLIYCSVTGYGQTGPYAARAGYDFAIQAQAGLMSVTGERDALPGGGPQKVGVAVSDLFTGMYATVAVLAALRHAERTGQGQHIDMALFDVQLAMLANLGASTLVSGKPPSRMGNAHQTIVPYQVFEVAPATGGDAQHLVLAVGNDGQFAKFCAVAGQPQWAQDPRFATNAARVRNRELLVPMLAALMKTRDKADWLAALEAQKVPCGPIQNLAEAFADPQTAARGMLEAVPHPLKADLQLVASPMKMSVTPPTLRHAPPQLGAHTQEVLREMGLVA